MKEEKSNLRENLSMQEKAGITRDLFERYRRGETSQAENEVIESLESRFIPKKEFKITDKLIDELEAETTDFIFRKIKKTKKPTLSPFFIGAAASVALLIVGVLVFYKPQQPQNNHLTQQYTATDTIESITLSDGSEITMNSGTKLRANSREVWLDEGEAFFNVKPEQKTFVVHLRNELTVSVLGTSFTIQSYEELPYQAVSVLSGKVNVSASDNKSVELTVNQQAIYREAGKELSKQPTNSVQKAEWRAGKIVLENASVNELRLRIKQLYGKNIVFQNQPETMSINITLDKTTSINEIADEIAALYDFSYQITNDKIVFQS